MERRSGFEVFVVAGLKADHHSRRIRWPGPARGRYNCGVLLTVLASKRDKRRRFTLVNGALKLSS